MTPEQIIKSRLAAVGLKDRAPKRAQLDPTQRKADEGAAWQALADAVAAGAAGWCQTTDKVYRITPKMSLASLRAHHLLDAEVAHGAKSLHVRHLGPNWQVTWLTEAPGDAYLVQLVERKAIDPDHPTRSGTVSYHAYWPVAVELDAKQQPQIQPQIQPAYVRFVALGAPEGAA